MRSFCLVSFHFLFFSSYCFTAYWHVLLVSPVTYKNALIDALDVGGCHQGRGIACICRTACSRVVVSFVSFREKRPQMGTPLASPDILSNGEGLATRPANVFCLSLLFLRAGR